MPKLIFLADAVNASSTLSFEDLDVDYGFVLYRTQLDGGPLSLPLTLPQVADNALVFVDGMLVATVWRNNGMWGLFLSLYCSLSPSR